MRPWLTAGMPSGAGISSSSPRRGRNAPAHRTSASCRARKAPLQAPRATTMPREARTLHLSPSSAVLVCTGKQQRAGRREKGMHGRAHIQSRCQHTCQQAGCRACAQRCLDGWLLSSPHHHASSMLPAPACRHGSHAATRKGKADPIAPMQRRAATSHTCARPSAPGPPAPTEPPPGAPPPPQTAR